MRRLTPSLVVSILALAVAVGGTAWAGSYLITSTKQIKPSVKRALKGNRGPRGYDGADGAQGSQGAQGSPGVLGVTVVDSPGATIPPGGNSYQTDPSGNNMKAQCPAGMTVVGTGIDTGIGNLDLLKKYGTFVGGFVDNDTSITITAKTQAICAQLPAGVAATRSAGDAEAFQQAAKAAAAKQESHR